jgi:hypothetical protein
MIAPVLRLTGTHSCAMKTLDTISSNSKMWPKSLTSSLPVARGRADFYDSQQGRDRPQLPDRKFTFPKSTMKLQAGNICTSLSGC